MGHVQIQNSIQPGAGKAPRKPPKDKSTEQVEREFVDAFVKGGEALSGESLKDRAQSFEATGLTPTTAAFLSVASCVAPVQALALAGASFATTQPQILETLEEPYADQREPLGQVGDGVELYAHPQVPAAFTNGAAVYINPSLTEHLNTPVLDWIVGHELGHIQSQDGLAAIGRSFLIGQLKRDKMDESLLQGLESAHHSLNRECEFESDAEGLEYAVSRGHSREVVVKSVGGFLSAMPGGFDTTHPEPADRIEKLQSGE